MSCGSFPRPAPQVPWSGGHIQLEIERHSLVRNSFDQIMAQSPHGMRQWMRVMFVGEAGVDVGGLEREWFLLLSKELFSPEQGLFKQCPGGGGYAINSDANSKEQLQMYEFVGRLLGKAIMERQSLPVALVAPLYKHMLRAPVGLDDLRSIDPELHRHVGWLDRYQDVGSLDLDFCVGSHELVEGGANVVVTNENKHEYLSLVLRWHLLGSIESQLWHLLRGLYTVVPPDVLRAFDFAELEFLFTGTQVRGRKWQPPCRVASRLDA